MNTPKFPLGRNVMTPGVQELVLTGLNLAELLKRHENGDWGDLDNSDKKANDRAVKNGDRILSAYVVRHQEKTVKVWVITEADRSSTCALLPDEH